MERNVKVLLIPPGRAPGAPPNPAKEITVAAPSTDGLRDAAREKLIAEGYRIRSISFGPAGLVAYVEAAP